MRGVDRLGLLEVEARGVRVDVLDVERLDHLVEAEDVAVRGDRPPQEGEVVQQPLGQEALVAVGEQVRLRVALGELLVALAHHVGQVADARGAAVADADLGQRVVQRHLARRARQQVLPAQHVGDLHEQVVDGRDQRVERVAVGAAEREVGDELGLERDLAADQVVERDRAVGHPEPHDRPAVLGPEGRDLLVGELAAEPVVPHHLGAGRQPAGRDLVGGAVAVVGELARRAASRARRRRCRSARTGGTARTGRP